MSEDESGVRLEFAQFGHFDSFTIYKQTTPIDLENLPEPIAVGLKTMHFVDTQVLLETTYHYLVATYRDSEVRYSEPTSIFVTFTPPYNIQSVWNATTQCIDLTWEFDW